MGIKTAFYNDILMPKFNGIYPNNSNISVKHEISKLNTKNITKLGNNNRFKNIIKIIDS